MFVQTSPTTLKREILNKRPQTSFRINYLQQYWQLSRRRSSDFLAWSAAMTYPVAATLRECRISLSAHWVVFFTNRKTLVCLKHKKILLSQKFHKPCPLLSENVHNLLFRSFLLFFLRCAMQKVNERFSWTRMMNFYRERLNLNHKILKQYRE